MTSMTTINIRTSTETKKAAERLFGEFGLSMTSAINIFLKQAIREQKIPFEIGCETPNELTARTIALAEQGKELCGPFKTLAELKESLDA